MEQNAPLEWRWPGDFDGEARVSGMLSGWADDETEKNEEKTREVEVRIRAEGPERAEKRMSSRAEQADGFGLACYVTVARLGRFAWAAAVSVSAGNMPSVKAENIQNQNLDKNNHDASLDSSLSSPHLQSSKSSARSWRNMADWPEPDV